MRCGVKRGVGATTHFVTTTKLLRHEQCFSARILNKQATENFELHISMQESVEVVARNKFKCDLSRETTAKKDYPAA